MFKWAYSSSQLSWNTYTMKCIEKFFTDFDCLVGSKKWVLFIRLNIPEKYLFFLSSFVPLLDVLGRFEKEAIEKKIAELLKCY